MAEKRTEESTAPAYDRKKRRKVLAAIAATGTAAAAGGIAPKSWKKPVVDAVLLPAHAQASPPGVVTAFTTVACTVTGGTISTGFVGGTTFTLSLSANFTFASLSGTTFFTSVSFGTGTVTVNGSLCTDVTGTITAGQQICNAVFDSFCTATTTVLPFGP